MCVGAGRDGRLSGTFAPIGRGRGAALWCGWAPSTRFPPDGAPDRLLLPARPAAGLGVCAQTCFPTCVLLALSSCPVHFPELGFLRSSLGWVWKVPALFKLRQAQKSFAGIHSRVIPVLAQRPGVP